MFLEIGEHLRIHQVRIKIVVGGGALQLLGKFRAHFLQIRPVAARRRWRERLSRRRFVARLGFA